MHKNIIWNTGPAAERARHNLRLNKNKKIKRASSPKLQAPSPKDGHKNFFWPTISHRTATIKKDNKI